VDAMLAGPNVEEMANSALDSSGITRGNVEMVRDTPEASTMTTQPKDYNTRIQTTIAPQTDSKSTDNKLQELIDAFTEVASHLRNVRVVQEPAF
jgi:predicted RNA-binding protein Jag